MTSNETGTFPPETPKRTFEAFDALKLCHPILRALSAEGDSPPTPIHTEAIPYVLDGRDLLGCAQTGTGKTAAFALPILHRLSTRPHVGRDTARPIRALVVTPTRELAVQVDESFRAYGRHTRLRMAVAYGGVSQNAQTRALRNGVD